MIEAYGPRSDWYVIDDAQAKSLAEIPGLGRVEKQGLWLAHRSHLPLIDVKVPSLERQHVPKFQDGTTLRNYQEEGARFLTGRRGVLLADGMRIGKTAQCIAAHDPDDGPLVVVGPLAVRSVWLDWFRRRWPDTPSAVLRGRKYDPKVNDASLIFTHYDILPKWQSIGLTRKIGTLVFDEAHLLSNRKSKRTQAALIMAPAAERVICATGTPLWNRTEGLWPLLSVTNPAAWGTYTAFTERYASGMPGAWGWETGAPSNVDEFRERLSEVMIRRRWEDVRDELPPTTRAIESAPMSARQALEIDKLAVQIREKFGDFAGAGSFTEVGELARIRRIVAQEKTKVATDCALRVVQSGEPVVVWVWHRDVGDTIAEKLKAKKVPTTLVTGAVEEEYREDLLDTWRGRPTGALIISMGVAPAGIDLSHAAHCIFAELDWTPATMGQAAMRTFSPARPNFETYVVAEHEIDRKLIEVLISKCDAAGELGIPATDTQTIAFNVFSDPSESAADLDRLADRIAKRTDS